MNVDDVETPELRLVKRDDPEAYSFNTPQYSAHKLPKEVCAITTFKALLGDGR